MLNRRSFHLILTARRFVPRPLRRLVFNHLVPRLAPRPAGQPTPRQPVSILAPFRSSIGIGWGARENAEIIAKAGFDVRCQDMTNLLFASDLADSFPDKFRNETEGPAPGPGVLLVHASPNHVPYAFLRLGKRALADKYIIGYWVWETQEPPVSWQRNLRFVHEIWCPSRFAANAFRSLTEKPVHVVPHSVEPPAQSFPDRPRFGIPPDTFAVLTAVHLGSGLTRKNPLAAIRAFDMAFSRSRRAVLVVKVSQADIYPDRMEEICREIQGIPNCILLQETLATRDYWRLLHSIDAILSLHRAEGFGLIPAQAMAIGKVAIATGWSGNMEYMNGDNSLPVNYSIVAASDPEGNYDQPGQKWAEPDLQHAASMLRKAAEDRLLRQRIGSAAVSDIRATLSHDAIGRIIHDRLGKIGVTPSSG